MPDDTEQLSLATQAALGQAPPRPQQPLSTATLAAIDPAAGAVQRGLERRQSWEQVAPAIEAVGGNPTQHEHQFKQAAARAKYAESQEDFLRFNLRNTLPGVSAGFNVGMNLRVRNARNRIAAGGADQSDYDLVASDERLRQVEAQRTGTQQLAAAIAGVPRMILETRAMSPAIGKAPAALRPVATAFAVPSMGVYEQATRAAAEDGSSPFDLKNAYPAVAKAVVTAAVLGRMGQADRAFLARVPIQTAKGMIEQQAGDTALSVIDHALPEAMQTRTKYGLVGQLVNGEKGEAAQHALTQGVTFAMFAALHGRPVKPVLDAQADVLDAAARKGQNVQQAVARINDFHAALSKAQAENPTATPAELAKALPRPSGAMGRYHDSVFQELAAIAEANKNAAPKTEPPAQGGQQPPPEEPPAGDLAAQPNPNPEPPSPLDVIPPDILAQTAKQIGLTAAAVKKQLPTNPTLQQYFGRVAEEYRPKPQVGESPTESRDKQVQRNLHNNLLDLPGEPSDGQIGQAFQKAGYKLVNGLWVHPGVDPDYVKALSPATVAAMHEHGVYYVHETPTSDIFGMPAAGNKVFLRAGNRTIGGIGVLSQSENVKGTFAGQNRVALHETGHYVWETLSPEQQALFKTAPPTTSYAREHAKNQTREAVEENFAERFAENKGDLGKTLREAKEAAQNAPGSTIAPEAVRPAETGDRATGANPEPPPAEQPPEPAPESTGSARRRAMMDRIKQAGAKSSAPADTTLADVVKAAGLDGQTEAGKSGEFAHYLDYPAEREGLQTVLRWHPEKRAVEVAFEFKGANGGLTATGRKQSPAAHAVGLMRDLTKIAQAAKEKGLAVEFRAEDKRAGIYDRGLTRAGFRRVGEPVAVGDAASGLKEYRYEAAPPGEQVAARPIPEPEVLKRPVVETDMGRNVGVKLAAAKTPEAREALYAEFDDLSKPDMRDALDAIGVPHKGLERPQMKEAVRQWADRQKPKPPPPALKRTRGGAVAPASRESLEHAARSQEPAQRQMAGEVLAGQAKQAGLTAEAFAAREHPQLHADLGDAGIRALAASEAQAVGRRLKEEVFRLVHQYSTSNGESGRVMPEELLKQFDALSPKEKKAALAEYGVTNTKALSGKKLSEAMRKEVEKRYDTQDRIFAGEDQPKKKQPKPGSTLRRAALRSGGIDIASADFTKHFAGAKEARKFGLTEPGLLKRGGRNLSQLAQELYNEGHLRTPDPDDLVDALKSGKESQHYYQSEEYQRHLQEEHDARREAEAAGHSAESIAEATRRGESAAEDRVEADAEVPPTAGDAAAGSAGRTAQGVSRPTDLFGEPIRADQPAKKGTQLTLEDQLREGWMDAGKAWAEEHGVEVGQWRAGGEFVDTDGRVYRVKNTDAGYKVEEVGGEEAESFDPSSFDNFGTPLTDAERHGMIGGGQPDAPDAERALRQTALANEQVDRERAQRGLPPLMAAARKTFGRLWDEAMGRLAVDPQAGAKLVDRLLNTPSATVNDVEGAMLLHRKIAVQNEAERAMHRAIEAMRTKQPDGVVNELNRRVDGLEAALVQLDRVTQKVGTQLGRSLAFRRQLAREDYSLSSLMLRAIRAKGNKPLTPEERAELEALAAKLEAAEARLAALEQKEQAGEKSDTAGGRVGRKRARAEADEFIAKLGERQLSLAQKVFRRTGDTLNAARSLLTAFDLSAVFRQGGMFTFGHPLKAARAFPEMIRSFGSQEGFDRARDALDQRENAAAYKSAGLHIADVGGPLSKQEEAFVGRWTKKIPGLAGSERAYTAFLNRVRADWYDALAASLPAGGKPTPAEARAIAKFVNIATGRGDAKALDRTASTLAHVFFSPRYVASRFQLLAGVPFWGGNAATRRVIAQEYGRTAAGLLVFYAVMAAANDDMKLTFDPRSADFGKVVEGKTRIDPLMGLSQTVVFPTRLLTGESTNTKSGNVQPLRGKHAAPTHNAETVIWRYLRSKLAPVPGTVYDVVKGETFDRQPATAVNVAGNYVPIAAADVAKNLEDQGVPRGAVNSVLAILGMGNQVYSK